MSPIGPQQKYAKRRDISAYWGLAEDPGHVGRHHTGALPRLHTMLITVESSAIGSPMDNSNGGQIAA
jgi:hypothetical protein